jgi:chromosome segregation ATPase
MPNINTRFTLSGEKEYKEAISKIGDGMRVLDAEMRKVTSAYGKNADSAKLLSKQNDILQRQIYSQTEKIRYMQEALKSAVERTGESSKAALNWQASLQNATAKLNALNNQMRENEKRMNGEQERKYRENIEKLSASMDVLDAEMQKLTTKYADNANAEELLSAKSDLLTRKIFLQNEKIDTLSKAVDKAAEQYGFGAVETSRWQKALENAEAELYSLNNQVDENNRKIKESGDTYAESNKQLAAEMKVLDSQMTLLNSEYSKNGDSVEALSAKNEVLSQKIGVQKSNVELLTEKLKESVAQYGDYDERTKDWQAQLNNAEAELNNLNNQFDENKQKIAESGKEMGNLGDVVNGLTSKLGIQLPDSMKQSMNAMGSLDASSLALAGGFAAVATAIVKAEKALISMTKEAASNADDLLTLASVTGMTTDSVQELNYMADLTDVSMDRIKDSLKETTNKMQEAAAGTGDAYDAYQRLGVEITNADGSLRSAKDVFYDTIDALGEIKNQTERDALAMDLMSESAQELNPLIDLGGEKMRAYAQEAHDMGYVLDNDALKSLQGVDDAYSRLQNTQEGVKNQLAAEFAPYLEEFYGDVTSGIKYIGDVLQQSGLVDSFGMLLETAGEIINPMDTLSNDKVPALTKALRPLSEVMAAIADAGDFLSGLLTLDFNKMGTALGLNYGKGQMSNVQKLNTKWMQQDTNRATAANGYGSYFDTDTGKAYGNMEAYANAQYEALVRAGDSSILGKSQDLWVQEYLKKLRGNAAGTDNWAGGWTRVNENGLERIYLPSGSRIQTASETRYTSGDTYNTTVYVDHVEDLDTILRIAKNARITTRMGAK